VAVASSYQLCVTAQIRENSYNHLTKNITDKIQHPSTIKTFSKLIIPRKLLNPVNSICANPPASTTLSAED
jgi:hypothetical protein